MNSRTVIAKDVVDITLKENTKRERLLAANKQDLNVLGIVKLKGTYHGKLVHMNCLVTDDLVNEIIVSWHDAHWVGAIVRPDYGDAALPPFKASRPGCNAISSP